MPSSYLEFGPLSASYVAPETDILRDLVKRIGLSDTDRRAICDTASQFVDAVRADAGQSSLMDAFLQEYGLSNEEGITLMRLAESLVRTPDFPTASYLIRDKLDDGDWSSHSADSSHLLVNAATQGLKITSGWIRASGGPMAVSLAARLGDRVLHAAIGRAMALMGEHFVLGDTIEAAIRKSARFDASKSTFSFDMLGEAALTDADATRYFESYKHAALCLSRSTANTGSITDAPGLSVKLSALHPRYEFAQRVECVPLLEERVSELAMIAKAGGFGLTIDAEEADRLEVSLLVFRRLLNNPELAGWNGLGLVVQAYQRRARHVIEWLNDAAREADRGVTVRLVKGAYWDSEIKRAQVMGLDSYPVFTRKSHTDVSYFACAAALLSSGDIIFPQFATHNAHTASAIAHMAGNNKYYEFQRLHGMSEGLHREFTETYGVTSRVYAPVGRHADLLPYLVRRLLENGANSSFVNQLLDLDIPVSEIVADPISKAEQAGLTPHPSIPMPRDLFKGERFSARGIDLTQASNAAQFEQVDQLDLASWRGAPGSNALEGPSLVVTGPMHPEVQFARLPTTSPEDIQSAITAGSVTPWSDPSFAIERSRILNVAADRLEEDMQAYMALCVIEAGKTLPDAEAEVREAVDFLRYYARQAKLPCMADLSPLGTIACISPWNFPLAIFLGQVSAALSVGNTVIAKPAEQTPLVAIKATQLLHDAGVPKSALSLAVGGKETGASLIAATGLDGVVFTGSTPTAKAIAASLADTGKADIPFIAETGGINTMIVDSTALLEQAVKDTIDSAFQSAGQRCSACRLVCVQSDIADDFIAMLAGAMARLNVGDPSRLSTDVGPLIDEAAHARIVQHVENMRDRFKVVGEAPLAIGLEDRFVAPIAFELRQISDLEEEIFGPVLHLVRFGAGGLEQLVEQINSMGYGLTMGLHTRIDARISALADHAEVGNLYVNRNQIGAVVGVQPFGGRGLSGTGPKAGGPNYLKRLTKRCLSYPRAQTPAPISLPGPTGETNTLSYRSRGILVCFGGDKPQDLAQQINASRRTGNLAVFVDQEGKSLSAADIRQTGVHEASGEFVPIAISRDTALHLLSDDIDGAVADGAERERVSEMLARRDGPILPVLSAYDDPTLFCHEQTLTVNTTAAGGNASLLAME